MQLLNIISLLTLTSLVSADTAWYHYDNNYYTYSGCSSALSAGVKFCKSQGKGSSCLCVNENGLASVLYCGYKSTHANNKKFNSWVADACKSFTNKTSDEYYAQVYQYALENIVDISNNTSFNASKIVTYPVTSKKLQKSAYNYKITTRNRSGNIKISHYLGVAFVAATFLVMLVSGLVNWSMRYSRGISDSFDNSITRKYRKFFNLKIFNKHLQPTVLGFNPDAFETFWIFIMFLYSILGNCIIGHEWYKFDTSFKTYQAGTSRYWGDRSCILLSYQLPFLFLFPGRNNFFQWITRWKYSRFVSFHKWLARIVLMELLIHSFAMASQTYALHKYTRFATDWYRYGIAGTVAGCLAGAVATYSVRKYWYEVFFCSHVVLVVMFLWTSWEHAKFLAYEGFYWVCCAIWVFDRFIRYCRMIINGVNDATIEYYPGEDVIIKIHVKANRFTKNFSPGSHAFITFLSKTTFWQTHPFTAFHSVVDPDTITFCCRVKNGVTKQIASKFKGTGVQSMNMKILIDGFYGEQSYYQQYDKAVFITGNTGISGPFEHIKKLTSSNSKTQVKLYWGIRSYDSLKWFAKELLSLKGTSCVPKVFISQPGKSQINISGSSTSDSDNKSEGDEDNEEKKFELDNENDIELHELLEFVEIVHSRMPISDIIDHELSDNVGNVAFGACAHNQVVDVTRKEVAKRLNTYEHRIDFFEEMQAW